MASTLTVNGTGYSQSARKTNSLIITGRGWDLDQGYWLEFMEYCAAPVPKFTGPRTCSATDNGGTLRFTGDIVSVEPTVGPFGRTWSYRALGLENRANQIPVTATDGAGVIVYNLPAESEDYIQANSGLSIGAIVSAVLSSHSSDLTAAGITTDATTATQLAALTLVPTDPVYITGERLWQSLVASFQRWNRNGRLWILPSGLVRVIDVTTGSSHTLTAPGGASADPIDPPLWRREWTHCATRVQARGRGRIRPAYVSLALSTLVKTWTGTDETNFLWTDFSKPADAYDEGTVTSVLGPTSVRVQSSSGSKTWATNFWSGRQAWVQLRKAAGSGLSYQESAPVTANTSLSAGGTSDLTLGLTLDNSGATAYDQYTLIGKVAPIASGRANTYRLYNVVTPGTWIEQHLVKRFPAPVPFIGVNNTSAQLTTTPCAMIIKSGVAYPASFRIIPSSGQILFDRPVVEALNSQAVLDAGGAGIAKPDDIYVMLAYSRGALTATYPPDSGGPVYSGTAYSAAALSRTRTADVSNWIYEGNTSAMVSFAQMIHASISDTLLDANIIYRGYYSALEDPSGGHTITTVEADAINGGTVSTTAPVRAYSVRHVYQGGGTLYQTEIRCTTRRDPRTDSAFYSHLSSFNRGGQFGPIAGLATQAAAIGAAARMAGAVGYGADQVAAATSAIGSMGGAAGGAIGGMGGAASGAISDQSAAASSAIGGMGRSAGESGYGGGPSGGSAIRNNYRGKRRRRPRPSPFPRDGFSGAPVMPEFVGPPGPENEAQGGDFFAASDPAEEARTRRRARASRRGPASSPAPPPPAIDDDGTPQGKDFYQ